MNNRKVPKLKNSYDIVAQAVLEYWNKSIPQSVVAFFYQKYSFEKDWEWCEELIYPESSDNYNDVIFHYDFCEGQTQVKNIKIVPLDTITTYYSEQHQLKSEGIRYDY